MAWRCKPNRNIHHNIINRNMEHIVLPIQLQALIKASYEQLKSIEEKTDQHVKSMIRGYLASIEGTENKNFTLSDDFRTLQVVDSEEAAQK